MLIGGALVLGRNDCRRCDQGAPASQRLVVIELSVNLNKIALLRNSRDGDQPERDRRRAHRASAPAHTASPCIRDRTSGTSVRTTSLIWRSVARRAIHGVEFNIEGNPFAGARDNGYPGFDALIESTRPDQCTLVPDGDNAADVGSRLGSEPRQRVSCVESIRRYQASVHA